MQQLRWSLNPLNLQFKVIWGLGPHTRHCGEREEESVAHVLQESQAGLGGR